VDLYIIPTFEIKKRKELKEGFIFADRRKYQQVSF
jgi:hypothetical protein